MKKVYLSVIAALYSVALLAEGTTGVDVNVSKSSGGGFPWLWVVGILLFIVLLVALLGGRGGSSTRVEKTVIKE